MLVGWMQVELNTAVWVGFIALFGLAVDDGVVMATYIHQLLQRRKINSVEDIRNTVYEAGLKRIRPCMMTTVTTLAALIPVMIATGRGADVARAMAIPVFGGMLAEPFTSFIVPTLYCGYLELKMRFGLQDELWQGHRRDARGKTTRCCMKDFSTNPFYFWRARMNRIAWMTAIVSMSMLFAATTFVNAQEPLGPLRQPKVVNGPHGGSLRQVDQVSVETVVSQAGVQVYLLDQSGNAIAVSQGRGVASVRIDGNAKRYRYDLVPDEKGGLIATLDLSKMEGRHLEIDLQLVGMPPLEARV